MHIYSAKRKIDSLFLGRVIKDLLHISVARDWTSVCVHNIRYVLSSFKFGLELLEVLLLVPHERTVAREEKVHLLKCPVGGLRIQSPY